MKSVYRCRFQENAFIEYVAVNQATAHLATPARVHRSTLWRIGNGHLPRLRLRGSVGHIGPALMVARQVYTGAGGHNILTKPMTETTEKQAL